MKRGGAIRVFVIFIVVVLLQIIIELLVDEKYTLGLGPVLVFGALWNLSNGLKLFPRLSDKRRFNINLFWVFTAFGVIWIVFLYVTVNIVANQQDAQWLTPFQAISYPIIGFTSLFAIFSAYYSVNFVAREIRQINEGASSKFLLMIQLMLYPIGIWYLQPRIDQSKSA